MKGQILGISFAVVGAVVLGMIIYDLVIKNAVAGLFANKYDNTFDPTGSSIEQLRQFAQSKDNQKYLVDEETGKLYRVVNKNKFAA